MTRNPSADFSLVAIPPGNHPETEQFRNMLRALAASRPPVLLNYKFERPKRVKKRVKVVVQEYWCPRSGENPQHVPELRGLRVVSRGDRAKDEVGRWIPGHFWVDG